MESGSDEWLHPTNTADVISYPRLIGPGTTQLCEIKDMGLICGRTTRRRRRDTGEIELVSDVDVALNISALARLQRLVDCNQTTCDFLHIPEENCEELCVQAYNRFIKVAMLWVKFPHDAYFLVIWHN